MQIFAKFINESKIEKAPRNKGAISNYNLSADLMTADGYKPLVVIEEPTQEKPLVKYRDGKEQIEQYAEAVPQPEPYVPTIEEKSESVRQVRNRMIDAFEWRISRNNDERELGLEETDDRVSLLEYRQYLRDYTKQENWYEQNPLDFDSWKGEQQ